MCINGDFNATSSILSVIAPLMVRNRNLKEQCATLANFLLFKKIFTP